MSEWDAIQPPLSVETLRAAVEMIEKAPRRVCGSTEPHVVHPGARGWTNCANCFGACFICPHDIRCNNARFIATRADEGD